jgi:phage terminase large subunit-like protein
MLTDATEYAQSIVDGRRPSGKWIFAAAKKFLADLERDDVYFDDDEGRRLVAFFRGLTLIGDASDEPFELRPWQLWALGNIWCWRRRDDHTRRVSNAILQVGRGNGKTTLMAALCLYDLCSGPGKRVHVIANREEQAMICVDTAKTMVSRMQVTDLETRFSHIMRKDADCIFTALPAKASSLDGLTPSLWIADEAAEYKGRFLSKLSSSMAKRREALGVIISTPADNPDGIYGEKVAHAEAILKGEVEDDSTVAMLFGIDDDDQLEDEEAWLKANPGAEHHQPSVKSLRRTWTSSRMTPMGRAEFARYHCCRMTEEQGGWLDMSLWPAPSEIDWASMRGRAAWVGLDLSKSLDLTALVVIVPLDDGRVALRGHYWWPSHAVAQREVDYRMPIRNWAANGKLTLTPGREVDYHAVRKTLKEIAEEFNLQSVAFDRWGSKYFAEVVQNEDRIPLEAYSQGISTMGPGCQLWQQYWVGGKFVISDDPIMRNACRTAIALRDTNGNIKVDKRRAQSIVDPLVSAIMGLHCWGGEVRSVYEDL